MQEIRLEVDLAMSVIALRWKNAPVEAYTRITNPPLDLATARRVMEGELTFQRNELDKWDLVAV